jgi:plastocyanin
MAVVLVLALAACDSGKPGETPKGGPTTSSGGGGGGGPAPTPIDPATVGAIKGRVLFEGTPPKDKKIPVDADPYCGSQHPDGFMSEVYKIAAGGEMANVFVWIKKGAEGRAVAVPATPVVLDQVGCRYEPHVLGVRAGQPLLIRNSDETMHNVHALPTVNPDFNFSQAKKGLENTKTFTSQEVMVKVKCDVHGWMGAWVGVVGHPWFAVTGASGAFELKDVPPGEYEVEAWHEKLGTSQQKVVLGAKESKELTFTFKTK